MLSAWLFLVALASALPQPIQSRESQDSPQTSSTNTSTVIPVPPSSIIHQESLVPTITFGIFSTILGLGTLVVAIMQYRRGQRQRVDGEEIEMESNLEMETGLVSPQDTDNCRTDHHPQGRASTMSSDRTVFEIAEPLPYTSCSPSRPYLVNYASMDSTDDRTTSMTPS
ncbi:hypothetical protein BDV95DRAFT_599242 [Massariosphaeria phaeospora]|uniref:Uncharacterized protein n=1 Tax=Massariosphaeria phaeospora TaxID=100035 RepID=A0A7C8HZ60_9PLEO|nr:hypothetical protein BDV95DRAFT_599242 [Massariosphaeria phaeospora]